ncbi:MAG: glycosyltransferase family 4 protein, partial [Methanocellales archaeon]|nr:glycosyltransferase family 4 protein [Methanocellales archaeon]
MKILMLCNTLWQNNLGRTLPFYIKVSEEHDVEIIGPLKKDTEIFEPYKGLMNYKPWSLPPTHRALELFLKESKDCDLIHCFKPLPWSYFPSLFLKFLRRKPVVLDIDDLDFYPLSFKDHISLRRVSTGLIRCSNAVVVNSSQLQKKFGGTLIRTNTDTDFCKPNVDGGEIKKKYGLEDSFTIVNVGTLKRYKGMDVVLEAVRQLNNEEIKVFLVGIDEITSDEFSKNLISKYKKILKDQLIILPPQPFNKLPKFLAAGDAVFLLHKYDAPWRGFEVPTKLYDAMAMGMPVVVSNVGDLPEVVGDSGITIPSDDVDACKNAIKMLYDDEKLRKKLGKKARDRCVEKYSWEVLK